jgi:hypothetical protein
MERAPAKAADALGPRVENGSELYIDDLVPTKKALQQFVKDDGKVGTKRYPRMFKDALTARKFDDFRMLSVDDGHLPGFGPENQITIEVLGPVAEKVGSKRALRWFGDVGKTKNGHSVVLKLKYDR